MVRSAQNVGRISVRTCGKWTGSWSSSLLTSSCLCIVATHKRNTNVIKFHRIRQKLNQQLRISRGPQNTKKFCGDKRSRKPKEMLTNRQKMTTERAQIKFKIDPRRISTNKKTLRQRSASLRDCEKRVARCRQKNLSRSMLIKMRSKTDLGSLLMISCWIIFRRTAKL
jgi:hypothetical protein